MTFHSDYKNLLVSEADILPRLKDAGIVLPAKLAGTFLESDKREDWQEIHALRNVFTAVEAVKAICGIDPSYAWDLSPEDDQKYDGYMSLLVDAVKHGELSGKVKNPLDAPYQWEIAHTDIYSWCEKNNIPWPFSKPVAPTVSNSLSKELEREQAKRQEVATAEQSKRRAAELEGLRLQLEQELAKREAAEAEVAALRREIEDMCYARKAAEEVAEREAARRHDDWLREQYNRQPDTLTTGLTFPYATKELEAMRTAVAKYWEGYTTDKRQPTQKEIGLELGELLGLPRQASGDPARKAIALAAAIKPSDLPDA